MDFSWDGSFLGNVKKKDMQFVQTLHGYKIYDIIFPKGDLRCMAKQITTSLPSLSDEFKPIFSLSKIGTHRIKCSGKLYLLIPENRLFSDKLSQTKDVNKIRSEEIRKIFVYRELLGLRSTHHGSIRVDTTETLSFVESSIQMDVHVSVIPATAIRRWFSEVTFEDQLQKMSETQEVARLRWQLEDVVNRIDKNYIWIVNVIIRRLLLRMGET